MHVDYIIIQANGEHLRYNSDFQKKLNDFLAVYFNPGFVIL